MPRFISFENDAVFPDLGQALKVSGFSVANQPTGVPLQEPFVWNPSLAPFLGVSGISYFAEAASGQFIPIDPKITWNLLNPITERPFTATEMRTSTQFKGFDISLLDETGLLVKNVISGFRGNSLNLNTDNLKVLFDSVYGDPALTVAQGVGKDPRKMRLKVVSNDYYGRQHTGEYYLTSPVPHITGVHVDLGTTLNFTPYCTKSTGLLGIGFYASHLADFDIDITGSGSRTYDFEMFVPANNANAYNISPPSLESGYYYKLVPFDNFGTGSGFLYPSSIRPFNIDPLAYSQVPSGMSGRLAVSQTAFDKITRPQLMLKWNRELGDGVNYEVKVEESGKFINRAQTLSIVPPSIEGVSNLVHGTGTGRLDRRFISLNSSLLDPVYSGREGTPIFEAYTEVNPGSDPSTGTGIKWREHTLFIDTLDSLPPGFYDGQKTIQEVAIASGFTESSTIYFGVTGYDYWLSNRDRRKLRQLFTDLSNRCGFKGGVKYGFLYNGVWYCIQLTATSSTSNIKI